MKTNKAGYDDSACYVKPMLVGMYPASPLRPSVSVEFGSNRELKRKSTFHKGITHDADSFSNNLSTCGRTSQQAEFATPGNLSVINSVQFNAHNDQIIRSTSCDAQKIIVEELAPDLKHKLDRFCSKAPDVKHLQEFTAYINGSVSLIGTFIAAHDAVKQKLSSIGGELSLSDCDEMWNRFLMLTKSALKAMKTPRFKIIWKNNYPQTPLGKQTISFIEQLDHSDYYDELEINSYDVDSYKKILLFDKTKTSQSPELEKLAALMANLRVILQDPVKSLLVPKSLAENLVNSKLAIACSTSKELSNYCIKLLSAVNYAFAQMNKVSEEASKTQDLSLKQKAELWCIMIAGEQVDWARKETAALIRLGNLSGGVNWWDHKCLNRTSKMSQ